MRDLFVVVDATAAIFDFHDGIGIFHLQYAPVGALVRLDFAAHADRFGFDDFYYPGAVGLGGEPGIDGDGVWICEKIRDFPRKAPAERMITMVANKTGLLFFYGCFLFVSVLHGFKHCMYIDKIYFPWSNARGSRFYLSIQAQGG